MASRTIPIEGVTPFEVDDTKNDEDVEREEDVPSCAGELEGTDSDQGLGPHVPGHTTENNSDQGLEPHVPGHTTENNSDQGLGPHVPTENCSVVTEGDISLSCSTAREGNPFYDSTSPASTLDFLPDSSRTISTEAVCDDTVQLQTHSVQPPNIRGQPSSHQPHKMILNDSSTTRPPEGVPHGGWVLCQDSWHSLINTCNLDQFLNGLFQICHFPPFLQLLIELAETFPDSYRNLLEAVLLCGEGRFAEAKSCLVPKIFDMLSSEGQRVMPIIEQQLCHQFDSECESCGVSSIGLEQNNVSFNKFKLFTSYQEAFRSYFYGHGVCTKEGCGGRTIRRPIFTTGTPPLILAVNLYFLHHLIPNSQVVEIVELLEERYMMFIFSIVRPDDLNLQIPGHYMSRCFRPTGGADSQGRPNGEWFFYPNNQSGSLYPWTTDQRYPDGTFPSYVYFIRIPASHEAAPCTGQVEEESPQRDDNEDDG